MTQKIKKIPKFFLKDRLFNQEKVEKLAREISAVYGDFEVQDFIQDCVQRFPEFELKQRMHHISDTLHAYLPKEYPKAISIIREALPTELDDTLCDNSFGDFIYAPYSEYVAKYGIEKQYLTSSLEILEEITKRFSVEFAIRPFLNIHREETLTKFHDWSRSPNYHVRRLASEGSRPRLPWGMKVDIHYTETSKILDSLFCDRARYVTRSVANHLNDISKIDVDYVLRKLDEWEKSKKQTEKEMLYITSHATRTMRKKEKKEI